MRVRTCVTRGLLLTASLIFSIGFSAQTTSAKTQWKEITEDKAKLLFYWISSRAPHATFKRSKDLFSFVEIGHWQPRDGLWPQVYLILHELQPDMQFTEGSSLREAIQGTYKTQRVTFGASGTSANGIGKLEFERFTLHSTMEIPCVGMRQFYGPLDQIPGKRALGDSLILGWYCAEPGTDLSEDTIRQFVRSVGVRGIALPQKP